MCSRGDAKTPARVALRVLKELGATRGRRVVAEDKSKITTVGHDNRVRELESDIIVRCDGSVQGEHLRR